MAPSYISVLTYFLIGVLKFTTLDFSLKNLTSEMFFFFGILALNTMLKNTSRGKLLRATGVLFTISIFSLIPLLYLIETNTRIPGLGVILIFTGMHSLFYELFYLPIMGIFLEICPENLEGFFMSMILLLNNFSRNIGYFLGVLCIYFLSITSTNFSNIYVLILINSLFCFIGLCVLFGASIPEKTKKARDDEVEHLEENYLAYINTLDSMFVEQSDGKGQSEKSKNIMSGQTKELIELKSQNSSIN